jgi:hypothetical protein
MPARTKEAGMIRCLRSAGVAAGLFLAIVVVAVPRPASAQAAAGTVIALMGRPLVTGSAGHAALASGSVVRVGDTIDVPQGSKVKLRMSDGSVLSLAPGTHLTITAYGNDATGHRDVEMGLGTGLLRAVVAKVAAPSRFEISTATSVAAARSTDWFVRVQADATQVGVLRGTVSLESRATRETVLIPARWGARDLAGMDPVPPRVWQPQEFAEVIALTDVN